VVGGGCVPRYAYFKKLDYFSTECIYSPNAYRGFAREFLKDLERIRPSAILGPRLLAFVCVCGRVSCRVVSLVRVASLLRAVSAGMDADIIHSGENMHLSTETKDKMPSVGKCERCGYISSQKLCKACVLLEGLNKGRPKVDISEAETTIAPPAAARD
jgi:cytoplasmic tRNA 2-thiolation protein 1